MDRTAHTQSVTGAVSVEAFRFQRVDKNQYVCVI